MIVGSAKASFSVHKTFVCAISPFFQGACNTFFKEALNDEVYLPEADPEAFEVFMAWVYTRIIKPLGPVPSKMSVADCEAWWMLLVKIYLLAHYLQSTSFGNAVMEFGSRSITHKHMLQNPHCAAIELVYNSTMGNCGLRRLFVALNVWRTPPECWEEEDGWRTYLGGLPAEYTQDLVIKLQRKNHQLDQDPFVNEKACHIFRDADIGCQMIKPAKDESQTPSPAPK